MPQPSLLMSPVIQIMSHIYTYFVQFQIKDFDECGNLKHFAKTSQNTKIFSLKNISLRECNLNFLYKAPFMSRKKWNKLWDIPIYLEKEHKQRCRCWNTRCSVEALISGWSNRHSNSCAINSLHSFLIAGLCVSISDEYSNTRLKTLIIGLLSPQNVLVTP